MNLRFTKYGITNALWSLIPIFPIWTLYPGVFIADFLNHFLCGCEESYSILLYVSSLIAVIIAGLYLFRLKKILNKDEGKVKLNFRIWSLVLYTFINTAAFILIAGTKMACEGDGQTIMVCIYSGPITSLSLIFFGIITDIRAFFYLKILK